MKQLSRLFFASLLLNAIVVAALMAGYWYYRDQRISWEMEAPHWAAYAGTMQCVSDHDGGLTRYYRLEIVPWAGDKIASRFTGEHINGVEVWSWPWYSSLGESSHASTKEFVDAYNRRMESFVKNPTTQQAN